jgi:activating signal cointegrator 1
MKVLSVRQPFATLIVLGIKRYEARSWSTEHRGQLAIHASSAAVGRNAIEEIECTPELLEAVLEAGFTTKESLRTLPRSAVVGTVDLTEVLPATDDVYELLTPRDRWLCGGWSDDGYYWRLSDPIEGDPVSVAGKLRLWELPRDLEEAVHSGVKRGGKGAPAADATGANGGTPLRLRLFVPSGGWEVLLGDRPRARFNAVRDLLTVLESLNAMSGEHRVRVTEELVPLLGSRKSMRRHDVVKQMYTCLRPLR